MNYGEAIYLFLERPFLVETTTEGIRTGISNDPETGGNYMMKRHKSEKQGDSTGSWQHTEIRLPPENL
jgi:hypothetical protein